MGPQRDSHDRPYCTTQGIIQQIGELGVGLITLILTVHTFVVALWRVGIRARNFAFGAVTLASLYIALWVSIGNGIHKHYETPTPYYWCWIGAGFEGERLAGEYIWLWIALFASVVMYIPLYFWTKGCFRSTPRSGTRFDSVSPMRVPTEASCVGNAFGKFRLSVVNVAHKLPSYPLAYSLMVLPLSDCSLVAVQ
ncbi:hypothetical protein EI94DRAFT_1877754 [Lactarius quietus]|nr:hypothetical protein EI94DRAFT_1877754 [Lactarius quietus]